MALQHSTGTLLRACMRSKHATATLSVLIGQQYHQPLPTSSHISLLLSQQAPVAGAAARELVGGGIRGFADVPSPSEPMIIPLRQQPSLQQPQPAGSPDRNRGPWEKVQDQASGNSYWWNSKTGVTTPVGAPKPDAWVEVVDKPTGIVYYWNQDSGDTTAVGEPMPGPEGRIVTVAHNLQEQQHLSPIALLGNSLAVGFGIGLVFGLIRWIF